MGLGRSGHLPIVSFKGLLDGWIIVVCAGPNIPLSPFAAPLQSAALPLFAVVCGRAGGKRRDGELAALATL
jgi:hypothetical protein